jgi:hypothetical protein
MPNGHLRPLFSELPQSGSIRPNETIRAALIFTEIVHCGGYALAKGHSGMRTSVLSPKIVKELSLVGISAR